MAIRRSKPLPFLVSGCTDTIDGTTSPEGSMAALTNLIPDPSTQGAFYCRPASVQQTDFSTYTTPGFISCMKVIGTMVYGLIASGRNANKDEPFCYDLNAAAFVTVSGITGANTPNSPTTSGSWTPPTMDLIGTKLVVTHPGFTGGGGIYFGWFDLSVAGAPAWDAGNTGGAVPLTSVPVAVKQFFNRAYYAVKNNLVLSDSLDALTVTNAGQVLTLGDNVNITALGGLPLDNQLGGIIQSLIAFKGVEQMWQISGDYAASGGTLAQNTLDVATGTLAPNTICPTPLGLAFVSPEGLRIIGFDAHISPPIGDAGQGIAVPFIFSNVPSRMCAAAGADLIRISTQNANAVNTPWQEWWFDLSRKIWTGPHSFPASLIAPYGNSFVMTPEGVDAKILLSDSVQGAATTFIENGTTLQWVWTTSRLADTEQMAESALGETTIAMSLTSGGADITCQALDGDQTIIDTATISQVGSSTIWGAFTWGAAVWQGALNAFKSRPINWSIPVVFRELALSLFGTSASNFKIGNAFLRIQILKYLQQ